MAELGDLESNEKALRLYLIGGDGVEGGVLEGFFEMSNSPLSSRMRAAFGGLLGLRTQRSQSCSNGGLSVKKPFPDSVGRRVAHGGAKVLEGQ